MNKKGQSEVLTTTLVFELIIGVLIASIMIYAVLNINNTSHFSKKYMEQDLFLTKEMARSLPGDLDIKYGTGGWCITKDEEFIKEVDCQIQVTKTEEKVDIKGVKKDEKGSI